MEERESFLVTGFGRVLVYYLVLFFSFINEKLLRSVLRDYFIGLRLYGCFMIELGLGSGY